MASLTPSISPVLERILEEKRKSVSEKKGRRALQELQSRIRDMEPTRAFQRAITLPSSPSSLGGRKGGGIPRLIAEIKKASPSKGILREKFDPAEIAKTYEGEGAAALSVLTEEPFFMGKLSYLMEVRSVVSLPILQKDFVLDEFQIYESRASGADALLLIPSLLTEQQAMDYFHLASELTLTLLVEVHTTQELESVLDWATVIGINNRDLKTFKTDIHNTPNLIKGIPSAVRERKAIVSESGIGSREDVLFLADVGVDALLIGEAFMVSESIPKKMKALMGRN